MRVFSLKLPLLQEIQCYFEQGLLKTQVYLLQGLTFGHCLSGPAIIIDKNRWVS